MLGSLGLVGPPAAEAVPTAPDPGDPDPDLDWARCGAMALTGHADGPPALAPGRPTVAMDGAALALRALARRSGEGRSRELERLDAPALLGERAALGGLTRAGRSAPGGRARLIRAADHWIAVQLARPDDVALVPAWLEAPVGDDPWPAIERAVRTRPAAALVARGRWMGLPMAIAGGAPRATPRWCRTTRLGAPGPPRPPSRLTVVDLSSLWAGPLATSLLGALGATVVKVESTPRPDGARQGSTAFFDLMHAGKQSVALDLGDPGQRRALAGLLEAADVVVESARPRALAQLGLHASAWLARRPGRTWLSITGYGRALPWGGWVAFGDDAAAAAGWCACDDPDTGPIFCGDALADPLTGLHAAVAALAACQAGGGVLLDVALRDVAAFALAEPAAARRRAPGEPRARVERHGDGWRLETPRGSVQVARPRARAPRGPAPPLGRHNDVWLSPRPPAC
ncbi:MAG: CoA transferase [Myxococcota bacterium]